MTARRLAAELLGTAGLLLVVVGSGIAASDGGAPSAQLFQHAVAVGVGLAALIVTFGPVSGAHFNPAVTLVDALFGGLSPRLAAGYVAAQTVGACLGVVGANLLFGDPAVTWSATARSGAALATSEAVATFGLLVVVFGVVRAHRPTVVAPAVGAWITAAIYATSSASFANPAVTLARTLTDSYTGIAPAGVPGYLAAQLVGALLAAAVIRWLFRPAPDDAADVLLPHDAEPDATERPAGDHTPSPRSELP